MTITADDFLMVVEGEATNRIIKDKLERAIGFGGTADDQVNISLSKMEMAMILALIDAVLL